MSDIKNCPYCGEEIMMSAKKCKHCGEWLNNEATTEITSTEVENSTPIVSEKTAKESSGMWKVPIILFLLIAFVVFLFINRSDDPRLRREIIGTYTFERVEVVEGLTISTSGTNLFSDFVFRSNGTITISGSDGWRTHSAEAEFRINAMYEIKNSYIIYSYSLIQMRVVRSNSRELTYILEEQLFPLLEHEMRANYNRERIVELNDRILKTEMYYRGERITTTFVSTSAPQNTSLSNSLDGVVINGVRWATRNVDAPGTFAASPESVGMFFQWNRRQSWAATGRVTGWDNSYAIGEIWARANDPCPTGWRVPTEDELRSLNNTRGSWTTRNGVNGRLFGTAPNQIFLPAAGLRYDGELLGTGEVGHYWSSTPFNSYQAWVFELSSEESIENFESCEGWAVFWCERAVGRSVRCVAEN